MMPSVMRFFGWVLTVAFCGFLVMLVVAVGESSEESRGAIPGIVFFMVVSGVPAFVLLKKGKAARQRMALEAWMVSLDGFTLAEAASRVGLTEHETEKLVLLISSERRLDLVFNRFERRFHRRKTIVQVQAEKERCPSCGAKLGAIELEKGETARCPYCDNPIRVIH